MGKTAVQNGLWSNAATWGSWTNTPAFHASTNISITNTDKFTDTFTAPSTTDSCVGVMFHSLVLGTRDWNVTLQEYNGATWSDVATATIPVVHRVVNVFLFVKFATPYTFTTTSAGYYRFKLRTASGDTSQVRASAGGTNIGCIAVDSRTGVPGAEPALISGDVANVITVTADGNISCGDGGRAEVALIPNPISLSGNAIIIGKNGKLVPDTAAPVNITLDGNLMISTNADLSAGTEVSRHTQNLTATFVEDVGGDFGIRTLNGKLNLWGVVKNYKSNYASGAGTAADPFITQSAMTDWVVGDEIKILSTGTSATAYQECENRFIITKNSDTSFVLSLTSGGAEAALTYTHAVGAVVLNLTRNILITTNNANGNFIYTYNTVTKDCALSYVRMDKLGSSPSIGDKEGLKYEVANNTMYIDGSVLYGFLNYGLILNLSKAKETHSDIIICNGSGTINGYGLNNASAGNNKTFNRVYVVDNQRYGSVFTAYNLTINDSYFNNNNKAGSTVGGVYLATCGGITFNNCSINGNRINGIYMGGAADVVFNDCNIGGVSTNTIDVQCVTDTYNKALFNNCTFGSATLVSNYLNMTPGSELYFHKVNGIENNDIIYTTYGTMRSTGAGLVDTTVRTVGTNNLRIAPESSDPGLTWRFKALARPNQILPITLFIRKNTAFGSDEATVNLYLPGSTTPDATYTLPNTTEEYLPVSLSANYTGSTYAYATVEIIAKSVTPNAYIYVADIMNGTNPITNLTTWDEGKPSEIMFEQLGDSVANGIAARDAVLGATASDFVASGSVGEVINKKLLKQEDFIALN